MTTKTLQKYKSYLYDEEGKPVAVQLDLRNKTMRMFYETLMEDFEDRMDAMQSLREDDELIPLEQIKAELEDKWNRD